MRDKWEQRSPRERRLLLIGGLVIGVILFYVLIWSPLSSAVSQQYQVRQTTSQLTQWMQVQHKLIARLKQAVGGGVRQRPTSLLLVTEKSLGEAKLTTYLKQVQQSDQKQLILRFEQVPFDRFIAWLQQLDRRYEMVIKAATVSRTRVVGVVNIELTLSAN